MAPITAQPQENMMTVPKPDDVEAQKAQEQGQEQGKTLRLRGGDGHHPISECICFLCICIGIEDLCCIGCLDGCFQMCC